MRIRIVVPCRAFNLLNTPQFKLDFGHQAARQIGLDSSHTPTCLPNPATAPS